MFSEKRIKSCGRKRPWLSLKLLSQGLSEEVSKAIKIICQVKIVVSRGVTPCIPCGAATGLVLGSTKPPVRMVPGDHPWMRWQKRQAGHLHASSDQVQNALSYGVYFYGSHTYS
jgi:hypothetical protein